MSLLIWSNWSGAGGSFSLIALRESYLFSNAIVSEGKSLKDEDVLQHLPVGTTATFYFRDLGAQISWVTVSSKHKLALTAPTHSKTRVSDWNQVLLRWEFPLWRKGVWDLKKSPCDFDVDLLPGCSHEHPPCFIFLFSKFPQCLFSSSSCQSQGFVPSNLSFLVFSGVSDRIHWPSGHLSAVLLPGSLHLRTQIWLHHQ